MFTPLFLNDNEMFKKCLSARANRAKLKHMCKAFMTGMHVLGVQNYERTHVQHVRSSFSSSLIMLIFLNFVAVAILIAFSPYMKHTFQPSTSRLLQNKGNQNLHSPG